MSGNPRGRKPGVEKLRQFLKPHTEAVMQKALDMALAGDALMLRAILDRLAPVPRSQHDAVVVAGLAEAATLTERANAIAAAAGRGEITPDAAALLLNAIAAACRIAEYDDLQRRISALELEQPT